MTMQEQMDAFYEKLQEAQQVIIDSVKNKGCPVKMPKIGYLADNIMIFDFALATDYNTSKSVIESEVKNGKVIFYDNKKRVVVTL